MRFAIPTAVLLLVLGTTASSYARQEKGQDDHAQDEHQQAAKPADKQAKSAKPAEKQAKPAEQQQTKNSKPAKQQDTQQAARASKPQASAANRAQPTNNGKTKELAQQSKAAGGNQGNSTHGRISNAHYSASFGSQHRFHVNQGEYDHRRFTYGGYSFGFIDPWPVGWGYSDDVYVVYVDQGYYMYDPVHPGVRISISIL
jgi:hypothetical protein